MDTIVRRNSRLAQLIFLLLIFFPGFIFIPLSGKADQTGPTEAITKLNSTLLEAMKGGKELGYEGRYKMLAPVIREYFALTQMARSTAGKYWESFSAEERDVYLKTYIEWTIASYAGRFDEYSGEQFSLVSVSPPDKGVVTVVSRLIASNKDEVEFNYQFRMVGGVWRIVDIRILGVSQLSLTKAQFVSILDKKGYQGLVSILYDKIRSLSQRKG